MIACVRACVRAGMRASLCASLSKRGCLASNVFIELLINRILPSESSLHNIDLLIRLRAHDVTGTNRMSIFSQLSRQNAIK